MHKYCQYSILLYVENSIRSIEDCRSGAHDAHTVYLISTFTVYDVVGSAVLDGNMMV